MDYYNLSVSDSLKNLSVDKDRGLSSRESNKRLVKHGSNKLVEKKRKSFFKKFLEQFSDFMVIILLIASAVSFFVSIVDRNNDYIDSIIILVIVLINALMGVIQESKAEKAIDALKKMSAPRARVLRDGKESYIESEKVVPGDIIILNTGDFVAADARIIESTDLRAEESTLTGESLPSKKFSDNTYPHNTPIADRHNMLFATSNITSGHAKAVVTHTGMSTEVGKIAHMINKEDSPQTPLQKKLATTGKYLGIGALIVCFMIFVLGIIQNVEPLEMFMISISLAVAAIPEGLPAIVTIVLAIGVRRMVSNKAVIRKLPAVETLGSTSVICSDKTGTLTQNKMTVTHVYMSGRDVGVKSKDAKEIFELASLCNNASLKNVQNEKKLLGDPTEVALLSAANDLEIVKSEIERSFPRVGEVPFNSDRKIMTTIHKTNFGKFRIITKGAPDVLLRKCKSFLDSNGEQVMLSASSKRNIELKNNEMAKNALRVISVAYKDVNEIPKSKNDMESGLIFCGLIGMIDPPRPEIFDAVKKCKRAGIKPVMITGDHIVTAKAIAKSLGIMSEGDQAITGTELEYITQEELEKNIFKYSVFARVSPEHKVRIVKAFQKQGNVVAMTGDGVNDAPALRAADIGCAMGVSGTDVAKNAADMVMTDDNFATIVEAVRQGRGIYENIRRAIRFLLSSNTGEIVTVLIAFLFHMPAPLLAIQLLWVNLVTDSLPALALGVEPVDSDIMNQKPISSKKSLFADGMMYNIAIEGCFIGAISILAFVIGRVFFDSFPSIVVGRTMAFTVLSLSQIVHALNVRSEKSLFEVGFFGNKRMVLSFIVCLVLQVSVVSIPMLTSIFRTVPLNINQWIITALLSLSPIIVVEIEKKITSKKKMG